MCAGVRRVSRLIPVLEGDLQSGCPMPFDILDHEGRLLLSRGLVPDSPAQTRHLTHFGFRHPDAHEQRVHETVFRRMSQLAGALVDLEQQLLRRERLDQWLNRTRTLCAELVALSDEDADAAFANVHLEIHQPYDVVHHLMAGLVCARLSGVLDMSAEDRFSLVAGAMTHDLALMPLRSALDRTQSLTTEQIALVHRHPEQGVRCLRDLGVDDPLWLSVVRDHHEYLDGSGYAGKRRHELDLHARILPLADALSAMLRPRPYRERFKAREALADLYRHSRDKYDMQLLALLIRDLGHYPPGSVVRLANREIAVTTRAMARPPDAPCAAAISDSQGRPLFEPCTRDTRRAEFAVAKPLDLGLAARASHSLEDCWSDSAPEG